MTRRKVTEPIQEAQQAALCFEAFTRYLKNNPGRRVVLAHDEGGFRVDLDEERKRTVHGGNLQDAAAQAGTVINADEVAS